MNGWEIVCFSILAGSFLVVCAILIGGFSMLPPKDCEDEDDEKH